MNKIFIIFGGKKRFHEMETMNYSLHIRPLVMRFPRSYASSPPGKAMARGIDKRFPFLALRYKLNNNPKIEVSVIFHDPKTNSWCKEYDDFNKISLPSFLCNENSLLKELLTTGSCPYHGTMSRVHGYFIDKGQLILVPQEDKI